MSIALPDAIQELIVQEVLDDRYRESLRHAQVFRALSTAREPWEGRLGEEKIITRNGLLPISTRPRPVGQDPVPQASPPQEQWRVRVDPYNDTKDTHLPTSYVMIQNDFLRDAMAVMIQAGTTINHLTRNKVYAAYSAGNTYATANSTGTSVSVASINGFTEVLGANGRIEPVSGARPLAITLGASTVRYVTAAVPDDAAYPEGPGTLTLSASATVTSADAVRASTRSLIARAGGATTALGIASGNKLTLALIRSKVALLRSRGVPTFPDGTYHMHLNSTSETQLFEDTEFANLMSGATLDDAVIRELMIGRVMGVTFIRNEETPNQYNTSAYDYVPFDTVVPSGANAGVVIHRPILLGNTGIVEMAVPKDAYKQEGRGLPKIGNFIVGNSGPYIDMDGIRVMIGEPKNRLQDTVSQTWAIECGHGIPTDAMVYGDDFYKRAVVFEHA